MTLRVVLLAILAAQGATAQSSTYIPPAPVQPLPFSHKLHVSKGLDCRDCHAMPDPGEKAGFPVTAKCMTCHAAIKKESEAIQKLADYHKKEEPVPWRRVYRVPDYVVFSHKVHVATAKLACETCHGAVRESDLMRKEKGTSMAVCVDCHKTRNVSIACDFCHDPR